MSVSEKMINSLEKASWVRKMFEEGAIRKEKYGSENVFDFSLGNPNLDPPVRLNEVLKKLISDDPSGIHGYMPNAGFLETRTAVAKYLTDLNHHSFGPEDIVMTVGAAGALNVLLKTILNPGDEVIIPKPYFMEYDFYIDNNGGIPKIVSTHPDFSLDISSIENAIGSKTKAVLINTPNNPTGKIYSKDRLDKLGGLLTRYSEKYGESIYLISDEPYSKIIYNGCVCPSIFDAYKETFRVTSFSKDLSLAGERIGYIAINPIISEKNTIIELLSLCNRILGYVNAPALMQRAMPFLLSDSVDISLYEHKRNILSNGLKEAGYDFELPDGTFYLFPKSPIPDDVAFVHALQEENILTVPGSAFGGPGHFRIAYCVKDQTIKRALFGFARTMEKYK
ncbi:MAG: pyridoxal phosphate-dependent aminotransferase [Desulfobacteraceae bacterium]|nr:pyridoxal phosphate-dependent aminotransferase [Desulfobacteraceae bacterium]